MGLNMQEKVRDFNQNKSCHKKQMPISARLLDIESEIGELAKEYLKNSKYGTTEFQVKNEFKIEFGDVLYCLLSLACELKIDAEQCLDMAILKYKNRIDKNDSMSSDNTVL